MMRTEMVQLLGLCLSRGLTGDLSPRWETGWNLSCQVSCVESCSLGWVCWMRHRWFGLDGGNGLSRFLLFPYLWYPCQAGMSGMVAVAGLGALAWQAWLVPMIV